MRIVNASNIYIMKTAKSKLFLLFSFQFVVQFLYCQVPYYPDTVWQTRPASELKMNTRIIGQCGKFCHKKRQQN